MGMVFVGCGVCIGYLSINSVAFVGSFGFVDSVCDWFDVLCYVFMVIVLLL